MRQFIVLFSLLGFFPGFSADRQTVTTDYVVSYLGIPVLDMQQTRTSRDSIVTIQYDNQLRTLFSPLMDLHNVYTVSFLADTYQPLRWSKDIREGKLRFQLTARRNASGNAVRYSTGEKRAFPQKAYTIFSATHFLESIAHDAERFPQKLKVYIDGEVWQATVNRYTSAENSMLEDHPPGTVLLRARLHRVGGSSIVAENDILTRHIATEGSQFLLWVDGSQRIIRARFGTFPTAVELDLVAGHNRD